MDSHQISVRPNGLTVVTINRPFQTAFVGIFNRVGGSNESQAENGISHFLEHMAFKGTKTRTPMDIVFEVEKLGSDVNAFTSKTMTTYFVNGLPDHIDCSLDILSDIMMNSTMSPEEIAREKQVVVEEIYESLDSIEDLALNTLISTAFPDQPSGRTILGPVENVEGFTQDILLDYMHRHYHANNMIVVAVGPVDHDIFSAMVGERFDSLDGREADHAQPTTYVGGHEIIRDHRFEQGHMFIGFEAPGKFEPGYVAYGLLADVLGTGQSSPLFQKVREELGLCYSIQAGMLPGGSISLFIIAGSSSGNNLDPMIKAAFGELTKIADGNLTDDDFNRAKNQIRIHTLSMLDKPIILASQIVESLFFNDGVLVMPNDYLAACDLVTKEDLIATAKSLVASNSTFVVVGNAKEKEYSLTA